MKLSRFIKRSMGLMLASLLLLSSLFIGLGLSLITLQSELSRHLSNFNQQSDNIFNLSIGSATSAAWALDARLAGEVASGIFSNSSVISVEIQADIRNGKYEQLVYLEREGLNTNGFTHWIAQMFFQDSSSLSQRLSINEQGSAVEVGSLNIKYNSDYLAEKYISSVYSIVLFIFVESFFIGLVLLLIARWLLTEPLKRAALAVAQISPEGLHKDHCSVPVPDIHNQNELGQLLHHTNQLVERLTNSQIELHRLATRDPLTGMANRTLIKEQLINMLAQARRSSGMVGVIFLDLDRFKTINDSLGHDIGDKLLKAVAKTLSQQVRQEDAVGRLGGDEFLFLLTANNTDDVIGYAERIINAMTKPYAVDGYEIRTNASLGIAMYPENGENADTLMRSADLAMYRAKADGASRWYLYSEDMREVLDEALELETALTGAIVRNELELFMQPQFNADNGKLAACEALLRWKYNDSWIAPYEFIHIAENTGMILEIGDWVIGETCAMLRRWAGEAVPVSVNVSSRQLDDTNFVARIFAAVKKYKIDPGLVKLEITETMLMENLDQCIERLSELRNAGFKISIDDFGTGYSSLAYLTRLPIDELKIDRSFVSGSQHSNVVLNTIIAMGRALNLQVVAEGVETEKQRNKLIDSGCDLLQGYLLGKPVPAREFEDNYLWASERFRKKA